MSPSTSGRTGGCPAASARATRRLSPTRRSRRRTATWWSRCSRRSSGRASAGPSSARTSPATRGSTRTRSAWSAATSSCPCSRPSSRHGRRPSGSRGSSGKACPWRRSTRWTGSSIDPQVRLREMVVDLEHPSLGTLRHPGDAGQGGWSPAVPPRPAARARRGHRPGASGAPGVFARAHRCAETAAGHRLT